MQEPQHGDCQDLKGRIEVLERCFARMREAYVKNDLGAEDYDGHRRAHAKMIEEDTIVSGYKRGITMQVLLAILAGITGLIGYGLIDWLRTHLK